MFSQYSTAKRSSHHALMHRLAEAFLPAGYPDSVSPDYLAFNVWDTTQVQRETRSCSICLVWLPHLRLSRSACHYAEKPAAYVGPNVWQAICSYVRGMLTSQAILVGVGFGRKVCLPMGLLGTAFRAVELHS